MTLLEASPGGVENDTVLPAVLLVDDEPAVLSALARTLRPNGVRVHMAEGGEAALAVLEAHGPAIGVVVSDFVMPRMTGAELLRAIRLRWPDTVRILLTGNADLSSAAQAVNEGHLSRLYTKPWQPDEFRQAIIQALEQHALSQDNRRLRALAREQAERLERWNLQLEALVAERTAELEHANADLERANGNLHRALLDTVRVLLGVLERRVPARAARCREIARLAGRLAERARQPTETVRRIQVAALVHDVGLATLPDVMLRRSVADLPRAGREHYERHPVIGQNLLSSVDQLASMGVWIRHHHERWDGCGYPDHLEGPAIPLASRLIALTDGYLEAAAGEGGTAPLWRRDQRGAGAYDPSLLGLLDDEIHSRPVQPEIAAVPALEVTAGMVVVEAIRTTAGAVAVPAGEALSARQVERLHHLAEQCALDASVVLVATPGQPERARPQPDARLI